MFKIEKSANGKVVVFTLSGRIEAGRLNELKKLLESEADDHSLVLDLKEVKLVDREGVNFLAVSEAKGMTLMHCPGYIREWINRERAYKSNGVA